VKKIAAFAINRPATMIVLVAAILIMGFLNLSKLPIALMPDIDLPYAAVITSYSGAGPQEVDEQVPKVLENSVGTVSGLDTMESTSNAGSSMILLSFAYGTDMDQALLDIRDKVERARNSLPDGADSPQVMKMDPNSQPVIQLTIGSSKLSLSQIQTMVEDTIEPRLARLSDIASVNVSGGREKEIQVLVDPVKVANYGLSLSQVSSCLRSENYNESSGSVSYGQRKYFVRSLQEFEKVEDIGKAALTTAAGNKIFLRDIAQIKMTNKDRSQITRTNGIYAVGISCQKETDANTVSACKAVKEEMEKLKKELGSDLEVQVVTDQSSYIQDSINNCARMMLEGAILAALVILVFLRNIRSTLVVVTAIPLSIIATFILLYYQGSTLNIITLGGLALGLGRMVDDSIVVFENIYRHRSLGLRPREAALTGTAQVGGAVLAGTLTLIAVFVPISQAEGIAGVLFKPFAVTICVAILCSLLVALTIVPFLSSRLLTDKAMTRSLGQGRGQRFVARMGDWLDNLGEYYKVLLQWALGNRRKVVLGVSGLTIISLCFLPLVGAEFMPSSDSGSITISLERDKGTVIEDMEKTAIQVEKLLRQNPAVDIVFTSIGSSGRLFSGSSVNEASITVQLVDKDQRRGVEEVAEEIRQSLQNVSGIKFSISIEDQMGGGSSGAINITVKGDNLETLKRISGEVANVVKNVAGTREVSSSLQDGDPEVQITINREKAADYGLTPYEVTKEIRNAIDGTVASSYRYEDDDLDVRVVNQGDSKQDLDMLKSLNINTSKGTVHLSQLATFVLDRGPVEIQRVDQVRQATISADLLNRDLTVL
jgi:HAE1 family hydrophobic/amphiphilic exporter-1